MKTRSVILGKIYREHGIKGACKFLVAEGYEDQIHLDQKYTLKKSADERGDVVVIKSLSAFGKYFLITFDKFKTPEDMKMWRGAMLCASMKDLKRDDDDLFDHEWEGLKIQTPAGEDVGIIKSIAYTPLRQLVVERGSKDILIPCVPEWFEEIDLENERVIMTIPEGLY